MNRLIEKLVSEILSDNLKIREDALVQIVGIIEQSTIADILEDRAMESGVQSEPYHSQLVSEDLRSVRLNQTVQAGLVKQLAEIIAMNSPQTNGLIWALSKARGTIAIDFLVPLLEINSSNFDKNGIYQALIALENYLMDSDDVESEQVLQKTKTNFPKQFFENAQDTQDEDIKSLATRVINRIYPTQP